MLALFVLYDMFSSPICLITCLASFVLAMLALCHLVWLFFFFVCIVASMFTCSCMCLCVLVYVINPSSYLWFCAGSHPSLYMKSQVPLRSFAWWHTYRLYSNLMELWIPNPNLLCPSRTSHLVCLFDTCLFDNMFLCPFVCSLLFVHLLASILSFLCLFSFTILLDLCFVCLLQEYAWSKGMTSKMQAKCAKWKQAQKGNVKQIRRLSLPVWLFLSLL